MTHRLAFVILIGAAGCGGKASEQTGRGASPASSTAVGPDSGAGIAGNGGGANAAVLVACAPAVGGAQPRPRCTTEYAVGSPCDPTTFQICSSLGYQAEIWCGRPAYCATPAPLPGEAGTNPCIGSCATLDEMCQWQINQFGGGVSPYVCCRDDDGGLVWVGGTDCSSPPL